MLNPILDTSNNYTAATYQGTPDAVKQLRGLPLGRNAAGELYLKVGEVTQSGTSSDQVQGTAADADPAVGNPIYVAGKAVDPATYAPAYTAGDAAAIPVNKDSGRVLVDSFNKQSSSASNFTPISAAAATTLYTLAFGERGFVQNTGTVPLYYKYGAGAASTSLSGILKASSTASDGTGGYVYVDDWIGAVSVAPASGTATLIAFKLSA